MVCHCPRFSGQGIVGKYNQVFSQPSFSTLILMYRESLEIHAGHPLWLLASDGTGICQPGYDHLCDWWHE